MSGLYNALFGQHPNADFFLQLLGLTQADVPRYRSCYWDGEHIVIHTRTGGGNREAYEDQNDALTQVSGYVRDEDDDFDSTYANFYFKPTAEVLAELQSLPAEMTPAEQWQRLLAALEKSQKPSTTPTLKRA